MVCFLFFYGKFINFYEKAVMYFLHVGWKKKEKKQFLDGKASPFRENLVGIKKGEINM